MLTRGESEPVVQIRPMREEDVPVLAALDFDYESQVALEWTAEPVEPSFSGSPDELWATAAQTAPRTVQTYSLMEVPLATPYVKRAYARDILEELNKAIGSQDDAVFVAGEPPTGVIHLTLDSWRRVATVWAMYVHRPYRGRGVARALMNRGIGWAREKGVAAVALETQNTNYAANCFYRAMGFSLAAVDPYFYAGTPVGRREKAIFWYYLLEHAGNGVEQQNA